MNTENKNLLSEIRKRFNEVQSNEIISGRKNWTKAFFDELKKVGLKNKFKVYSSSTSEFISEEYGGGEWLFDLCWSFEGEMKDSWKNNFRGLKLICESEWLMKEDEIIYDFQKLAVGKAEIKIMIVQFNSIKQFEDIKQWCEQSVDKSLSEDNSNYILVGSGNEDKEVQWVELWSKKN